MDRFLSYVLGVPIYFTLKFIILLINGKKILNPIFINDNRFNIFFHPVSLDKIKIIDNALLPQNLFINNKTFGMGMGKYIFLAFPFLMEDNYSLKILFHELVHIQQAAERKSEIKFAADYAFGFLNAKSYRKNPLEIEAYNFVQINFNILLKNSCNIN